MEEVEETSDLDVATRPERARPLRRPAPAGDPVLEPASPERSVPSLRPTLTPEEALLSDEIQRTRLFLRACVVLGSGFGLVTPLLSAPLFARAMMGAACTIALVLMLGFLHRLRDEARYDRRSWTIVSVVLIALCPIAIFFMGLFSPAPMVATFGIYFLCLGSSHAVALGAYLTAVVLYVGPVLAITFGLWEDPGLFTGGRATVTDKLLVTVFVQLVYALTYLLGRGSRKATREAVTRLHDALMQVQKREALLTEAHQELDRALKGGLGRYSDRRVGPYELGEVIGRGAMSEVYRAQHVGSTEVAAVKVLNRDLGAVPQQVKRFLREAEIVSGLESPHVVRVRSFGNFGTPVDLDQPPYIAMELLEGHDLAWHLRRARRFDCAQVLELVDHVAAALGAAQAAAVVHRDLKPQNIFRVEEEGRAVWKVLDFGVSKLASSKGTLTRDAIVGTPGYMSPEQARAGDVGPPADVFALAVIAYRALTGRPAFAGKELPRVLFDVCYQQPAQPSRLQPLPDDVDRVLALGLAKRPEDRIGSARDFAELLHAAVEGRLDLETRHRADALVARMPWGAQVYEN